MRKSAVIFCALVFAWGARASWYWPFGSDDEGVKPPRISELMEPVTELIDEASDLAADGKISESVEKYRKVLAELDRLERENPERAKSTEFATVRNKRAYVNAAIDEMLLRQVKQNARAVAVSDTTELERKLAEERGEIPVKVEGEAEEKKVEEEGGEPSEPEAVDVQRKSKNSAVRLPTATPAKPTATPAKPTAKPATKRERVIRAISSGDYAVAETLIGEMLAEKPNGAMALNLRAALEMRQGKLDAAERTLDQAIMSNPRNHSAYYNLAMLQLQKDIGNKSSAKRYYETGRAMGGPADAELEELLK